MKLIETLKTNFFSIIFFVATIWLLNDVFSIDLLNLLLLVGGFLFIFSTRYLEKFWGGQNKSNVLFAVAILIVSYVFFESPINIAAFLLGCNLAALYNQVSLIDKKTFDVSIINVIGISNILLFSGIEKFRGANKLDQTDIQLTIPLVVLASLMVLALSFFAYSVLSKRTTSHLKSKITFVGYLIFAVALLAFTYPIYKEVGFDTMFIPLICGVIAGFMRGFINPKTIFNDILEVVMCILLPFQISGFMGIGLAILTFFISFYIVGALINSQKTISIISLAKFTPLLFLLASQEIRENQGLISRLDIINGYQLAWLLIAIIVIKFVTSYFKVFRQWLTKNEIQRLLTSAIPLLTLLLFVTMIRFGRAESTVALVTGFVAFLYMFSLYESKIRKAELRLASSLSQFVGILSFLVLTTF